MFKALRLNRMDFAYALSHYFLPGHTNNNKAKILHSSSIFLLAVFLIVYQIIIEVLPLSGIRVLGYAANIKPDEIIRLTNQKRAQAGVPSLEYNYALSEAARLKGENMLLLDYWAHTAPDGTEPWKFFADVDYKYRYAGENLARDFSDPTSAVDAWMASPSHRDNLLSGKYKEIGVAVVEGDMAGVDTTIIVQLFGTRLTDTTAEIPAAQAKAQIIPSVTRIPSISITPDITGQVTISGNENIISTNKPIEEKTSGFKILLSPFESTRSVAIVTTTLLLIVLVVDGIIVARRKIPRISGRVFAHLAFLGMILSILLIARAGKIM